MVVWIGVVWRQGRRGARRWLPVLLGLGWLAVAAGAVDLLHQRLPDALTLPALPLALLLLAPLGPEVVLRAVVGAVVAFVAYAAAHLAAPAAMGAGDVKLAGRSARYWPGCRGRRSSWPRRSPHSSAVPLAGSALLSGAAGAPLPHGPSMLLAVSSWPPTARAGRDPGGRASGAACA